MGGQLKHVWCPCRSESKASQQVDTLVAARKVQVFSPAYQAISLPCYVIVCLSKRMSTFFCYWFNVWDVCLSLSNPSCDLIFEFWLVYLSSILELMCLVMINGSDLIDLIQDIVITLKTLVMSVLVVFNLHLCECFALKCGF